MTKRVLLFGKEGCSLCEGWKRKLSSLGISFVYYDTGTRDGLAEMAYHNIGRIPGLVIGNERWEEVSPADISSAEIQKRVNGQ